VRIHTELRAKGVTLELQLHLEYLVEHAEGARLGARSRLRGGNGIALIGRRQHTATEAPKTITFLKASHRGARSVAEAIGRDGLPSPTWTRVPADGGRRSRPGDSREGACGGKAGSGGCPSTRHLRRLAHGKREKGVGKSSFSERGGESSLSSADVTNSASLARDCTLERFFSLCHRAMEFSLPAE